MEAPEWWKDFRVRLLDRSKRCHDSFDISVLYRYCNKYSQETFTNSANTYLIPHKLENDEYRALRFKTIFNGDGIMVYLNNHGGLASHFSMSWNDVSSSNRQDTEKLKVHYIDLLAPERKTYSAKGAADTFDDPRRRVQRRIRHTERRHPRDIPTRVLPVQRVHCTRTGRYIQGRRTDRC